MRPVRIEGKFMGTELPMSYEDARDLAYRIGILNGHGVFRNPTPGVDAEFVRIAFLEDATAKLRSANTEEVRFDTNARIGAARPTRQA